MKLPLLNTGTNDKRKARNALASQAERVVYYDARKCGVHLLSTGRAATDGAPAGGRRARNAAQPTRNTLY